MPILFGVSHGTWTKIEARMSDELSKKPDADKVMEILRDRSEPVPYSGYTPVRHSPDAQGGRMVSFVPEERIDIPKRLRDIANAIESGRITGVMEQMDLSAGTAVDNIRIVLNLKARG